MSVVAEERILVVPTSLFNELGYFQGFSREIDRYWPQLVTGDHVEYRARGEMEEDPSFKQLIPYVLFRWTDAAGTPHLFEYQRGSGQGERRLHAKRSVGIGGHISSIDSGVGPSHHVYREGMRRELEEEVLINTPYEETVVGLINDDETPVGRVHLGMVHLCDVQQPNVRPREADILDTRFTPVADILERLEQFESWSQIAVRALFGEE
ncbi:MAG TPA: phosphoesterase [Lacipirellulaceae bacterium]|nr:phosphoesterase [Lacipirellulaceae bacterium]